MISYSYPIGAIHDHTALHSDGKATQLYVALSTSDSFQGPVGIITTARDYTCQPLVIRRYEALGKITEGRRRGEAAEASK